MRILFRVDWMVMDSKPICRILELFIFLESIVKYFCKEWQTYFVLLFSKDSSGEVDVAKLLKSLGVLVF